VTARFSFSAPFQSPQSTRLRQETEKANAEGVRPRVVVFQGFFRDRLILRWVDVTRLGDWNVWLARGDGEGA
jgi:transposase